MRNAEGSTVMSHDEANGASTPKGKHPTPLLDELESGPWPSFVTGLKRLRDSGDKQYAPMMNDLLGQLEQIDPQTSNADSLSTSFFV